MQRPLSDGTGVAGPASLRVTGRRYPGSAYGGSVPDPTPPTALTIAGSDSGGGAGAQADLKTFAALRRARHLRPDRGDGAEHGRGARRRRSWSRRSCSQQVETVLDDFDVRGVKTGMLATAGIVAAVADLAARGLLPQSGGGPGPGVLHRTPAAASPTASTAYLQLLLPHALVVTPNLREAAVLGEVRRSTPSVTLDARIAVAEHIRSTGARYVVVKGGHLTDSADDVVAGPEGIVVLPGERVDDGERPRHGLLPLRRGGRATWPRGPPCPRRSPGPSRSWRGPWPAAPPGGWAPGTAPSTISGGQRPRRLGAS